MKKTFFALLFIVLGSLAIGAFVPVPNNIAGADTTTVDEVSWGIVLGIMNSLQSPNSLYDMQITEGVNGTITASVQTTLWASITDKTVASTTAVSIFPTGGMGTTTIPANFLLTNKQFTITIYGNYTTPVLNAATLTLVGKAGTSTLKSVTTGALTALATNFPFSINYFCTVRSIGVSGTMMCNGAFTYNSGLLGGSPTIVDISTGLVTLNTTIDNKIDMTAAFSSVAGGQTATINQSNISFLN